MIDNQSLELLIYTMLS